jgi:putative ABC transport system permease protein
MLGNFFKVALRVFIRDRVHTLINIFGLAIGLAFSIVIFLYVHKEISYDRFHENASRIYRVVIKGKVADNTFNHAVSPAPLAVKMTGEIPEIEKAVRVARFGAWLVRYGNAKYNEDHIIFTDPSFFEMFSFPLIQGIPEEVLKKPNSIVLSRKAVQRYFGSEDPIGKRLRIENDSTYYTVTGIMEDVPENSHMHFDMVGSLSTYDWIVSNERWVANFIYTYVLVREGASLDPINSQLQDMVMKYVLPNYRKMLDLKNTPDEPNKDFYAFILQPLKEIHLKSHLATEFEPVGNIFYVYIFTILAIIIMMLSCLNFISLVTAQAIFRAKEVGIRKIAGSERNTLIRQFLLESSLLAFFAMAIALFFIELALPSFSRFIGLNLSLGQLLNSAGIILMVTLILVIGLFSGLYPAWQLSSFDPATVMHNWMLQGNRKNCFRNMLVLFQLFIAIGAIIMTLLVFSQFRYLIRKERGYDTENLVVIRRPDGLAGKLEAYKGQVSRHSGVISVTNSTSIPGSNFSRMPYYLEGTPVTRNFVNAVAFVSYGFDSTYRLQLTMGRFFDRSLPGDSATCVINETAAHVMGIENPVGKTIIQLTEKPQKRFVFRIIGVVRDFHFETLENPITPLVMVLMPGNLEGYLSVRLTPDNQAATVQYLKEEWERFTSAYPFVSYFLEKDRQARYSPVKQTGKVFLLLSVIAVIIASMGLFSFVSYNYHRKKREIALQKAMGASNLQIILHKIMQIGKMLLASSVVAWIVAYFLAVSWFKDYAYHIRMNFLYFLLATGILLVISMITTYYHAWLASRTNPGMVLKYE